MVLLKEFKKSVDDDYENMSVVTGSMRLVLKGLQKGMIPHKSYTEKELVAFCESLIKNQEADGSWTVFKPEYTVSEEDEQDFIYFPTQIACSILSYFSQNFSISSHVKGLREAMASGLKFSVSRNLEGYGFNSPFQTLESLIIFMEGSVIELLNKDPRICPSCYNRLIELKEEIQKRVDTGDTVMDFGGDYREQYEFVLKGLANI